MKTSRFSFYLFMLLLSGMTMFSCSKDNPVESDEGTEEPGTEEPEEPAEDEEVAVLNENAFVLTEDILNYVENDVVTEHSIKLSNAIPESELPKVGQVIVCGVDSEKFPYGFMGKVEQVLSSGGSYEVQTVPASLTEAFDELSINQDLEFEVEADEETRASFIVTPYTDAEGFKGASLNLGGLSVGDKLNGKINGSIGFGFKANFLFEYKGILPSVGLTVDAKEICNLTSSLSGKLSGKFLNIPIPINAKSIKIPIKAIKKVPDARAIQVVPIVIYIVIGPSVEVSFVGEGEGVVETETSLSGTSSVIRTEIFYKNGILNKVGCGILSDESFDLGMTKLNMNGNLWLGLRVAFKLSPEWAKDTDLFSISTDVGPSLEAKIKEIGSPDFYEINKDETLDLAGHWKGKWEANFTSLVKKEKEEVDTVNILKHEAEIFDIPFGERQYPLFPKFTNMEAKRSSQEKTEAIVTSAVVNDLPYSVNIDYRLYDEDGIELPVEKAWKVYQKEEEMNNPFMKTISDLDMDKKYIVRPIIDMPIFGEIEASPSVEIEPEISVTTEHYLSQGESLTLLGSFDPALQADCNITEYGICYDTSGNPTLYGTHNAASGNDEGLFQTTIIAEDDVTYYYRAYLIADGQIYYGEVKEAKKEKNDSIIGYWKLKSTHSETIGADHPHDDPGWTWGDLLIKADGTFLTGDPTLYGNWGYSSGSLLLEYEDEGEMLNFYFRINQLDEQILDVVMTVYNDSEVYKMYVTFERLY